MSAGMAYEAMNNAGASRSRLIIILNDNDMSIAPPVGAMSAYLSRVVSSSSYQTLRNFAKQLAKKMPHFVEDTARNAEEYTHGYVDGRHAVRGTGPLLRRPDRRPQSRSPVARARRTCATPTSTGRSWSTS